MLLNKQFHSKFNCSGFLSASSRLKCFLAHSLLALLGSAGPKVAPSMKIMKAIHAALGAGTILSSQSRSPQSPLNQASQLKQVRVASQLLATSWYLVHWKWCTLGVSRGPPQPYTKAFPPQGKPGHINLQVEWPPANRSSLVANGGPAGPKVVPGLNRWNDMKWSYTLWYTLW